MKRDTELFRFSTRCQRTPGPPTVVLGSSVNALSFVRSLGRRGIPVLTVDAFPGIGSKSRFGSFFPLVVESADDIPGETAADELFSALNARGITPVAFGTGDAWQVYIAQRTANGDPPFMSLAPSRSVIERLVDKQMQYEFASAHGVPVPAFANAHSVSCGEIAWDAYPAIIKPRWAHLGRSVIGGKVLSIDTEDALHRMLCDLASRANLADYLVQKVIPGPDECLYAYLGCFDSEGREFSHLMKRKLRQHPPIFGDGSYDVTCRDDELVEVSRDLLKALGYRGLVGIEFKRTRDPDGFALIEINPRTVSTNQLAIRSGVDFPWHAYQIMLHRDQPESIDVPASARTGRPGVYHMHEERDVLSLLPRWQRGEITLLGWLRCVFRARSFAIWDVSDPWPFLCMAAALIGRQLKRPLAALRPTSTQSHRASPARTERHPACARGGVAPTVASRPPDA